MSSRPDGCSVLAATPRRTDAAVADVFISYSRRVDVPIAPSPGDGLSALLDWGRAGLDSGLSVDDLARRAAMSRRTLARRFQASVGMPPGEWLQRERLRLARRLLESTDDPVQRVARQAGYDSPATMRAQFASRLQTSPRVYRRTFREG
jgi:AraC family transcriptional activator FtrA